jgi:hypothetical protein
VHRGRGSAGRGDERGGVMNVKAFFVDALASAIELGVGTPEDVLRHVTPDVLAQHLPRPLWARLLTACLGAPKVDATLIVETIGVPNLAEHIPAHIIWGCIADIAARALGSHDEVRVAATAAASAFAARKTQQTKPPPVGLAPPPEERPTATGAAPVSIGPSIPAPSPTAAANQPLADLITELEQDGGAEPRLANLRPRSPTAPRFRQSNTAVGRGTLGARRPQAAATPVAPQAQGTGTMGRTPRRTGTEVSEEPETAVEGADWRGREIAVDDSQLVDWQADNATASSAITGDDDFSDLGRKR